MTPPSYQGIGLKTGIRPIAEINTNTNTNNEDDDDNNEDSNNNNDDTNTNTNIKIKNKTSRTIRISEELYKKICEHSRRYYNTEPYETIIENLLESYEKHNQDKHWWDNNGVVVADI